MTTTRMMASSASSERAVRAPRAPSVLRSGLAIVALKLRLTIRGYAGTLAWIRRRVEGVPEADVADPATVQAAEWSVAMAAAFYPGRAQCLERSLVLYYLLRRQGIPVRYCHGVQPLPLMSHAWIEYQGEVINDVPERIREFSRFPDQLP